MLGGDLLVLRISCCILLVWGYGSRGRPRLEDSGSGRLLGQWQGKGLLFGLGGVKQGTKIPFGVGQGPGR